MKSFGIITGQQNSETTLLSKTIRWELAEWCKAISFTLSVLVYFALSFAQKLFLDADVSQYIFTAGAIIACIHLVNIHISSEKSSGTRFLSFSYFADAAFIASLILFTRSASSIFLILASFNIILAAFVRGTRFSLDIAIFTAAICNLFFIGIIPIGPSLLKSVLIFNGAFFIIAILSGILADELASVAALADDRGEDLRSLQNVNDLIVEGISSGVITTDLSGQVLHSNKGAAKILEDLAVIKRHINEIFPGLWAEVRHLDKSESFDWKYVSPTGTPMQIEMTVTPLNIRTKPSGVIFLFRDVTEIRTLESKLRQNEKLAAVGQLAAGIAHEIRNPLASISGSVQLLSGTLKIETPEDKKLIAIVIKEIDRLNDLISEFMDYVRPEIHADDTIQIDSLLNEILDSLTHNERLPKGVKVIRNFQKVSPIRGHTSQLKQAFLNILINAYQALEKSFMKQIEVIVESHDESIEVIIKDSGVGISPENLHRIFEPFHTTKPKGTGLGLAITRKVIESHGASIDVASALGQGTTFYVKIPVKSH